MDVSYVKIIATFYDKDDIVIGTDYTYTDPSDLRSGQEAPYDISVSDSDVNEIAKAIYSLQWHYSIVVFLKPVSIFSEIFSENYPTRLAFDPHLGHEISGCSLPQLMQ